MARPRAAGLALAIGLLFAAGVVAAGCDASPDPVDAPVPIGIRAENQGFLLQVSLPSQAFASADAIPVTTTLTWTGPAARASIWGSGSGPVEFLITEVGGGRRSMGGAMTADCRPSSYPRGVPVDVPLVKSGGYSGDDPNAAFYQAWYADPVLRLPAGRWQLRVTAIGFLAPCAAGAPELDLATAPIELLIR